MSRIAPALESLESSIEEIAHEIPARALAVSVFDYETGLAWARQAIALK
jgi:hypothetical protein